MNTETFDRRMTVPAASGLRRISWGAVFAGVVIAVVMQLVLGLLGAGIGLSTVDPLRHSTPDAATLGMGAGIWWVLSSVIALFAGGWVAGHLAGSPEKTDALLHGLLTWGVATLVSVYLLASLVSSVVRGGASVLGTAASVTAAGVGAASVPLADMAKSQLASSGVTLDSVKAEVQKLLMQTGSPALLPASVSGQASAAAGQLTAPSAGAASAEQTSEVLQNVLQRIMTAEAVTVDPADREALAEVVMSLTGVDRAEADQRTSTWIQQYEAARAEYEQTKIEAEAQARQMADDTASASSKTALSAVAALVLGAIAAALGGMLARRHVTRVPAARASTAPITRQ